MLVSFVMFEPGFELSRKTNSAEVRVMVGMIKRDIGTLEPSFKSKTLQEVAEIAERGAYTIKGKRTTQVDLTEAEGILSGYRNGSEGGCKSCQHMMSYEVDAGDNSWFMYCIPHEKSYDAASRACKYGIGHSEEVTKHFNTPCADWKPLFSPPLAELLKD